MNILHALVWLILVVVLDALGASPDAMPALPDDWSYRHLWPLISWIGLTLARRRMR